MNKIVSKLIIISLYILSPIFLFAQKDSVFIKRIPHQISVEFGYRNSFYQNTYLLNDGTYALFDGNGKEIGRAHV